MSGRYAYLGHLLGWGLPVLALQVMGIVARDGRGALATARAVLPAVLLVSAWLVLGDEVAVWAGIWRFAADRHLDLRVGVLPLEEVLFFVLANALVAGGIVLFGAGTER